MRVTGSLVVRIAGNSENHRGLIVRISLPDEMVHEAGDAMIGQSFIYLKNINFFVLTFGAVISPSLRLFE